MNLKKWLIVLIIIIIVIIAILFNMFFINPKVITVKEKTFTSQKITPALDDVLIVYFSDLHYGTAIKEKEMQKLVALINSFDPDIVLFGGDLVDDIAEYDFKEGEEKDFIDKLKAIDARLGKYAVLGNHDLGSNIIKETIKGYLTNADFEVLENNSVRIYEGDSSIEIVGIESQVLGNPDVAKAYQNTDKDNLIITLCHTPDIFEEISEDDSDLMFAGHSHGGQIYLPLLSNFYMPLAAEKYNKGEYHKGSSTLEVTNGVGTTLFDARLFADSEIIVYRLKTNGS